MNDIVRRNHEGVLLRYADPGEQRPHHVERRVHINDRRRCDLIEAEREIMSMTIMFDHMELSVIARTRLDDGLERIRKALNLRRPTYGLTPAKAEEAA